MPALAPATAFKKSSPGPAPAASCYTVVLYLRKIQFWWLQYNMSSRQWMVSVSSWDTGLCKEEGAYWFPHHLHLEKKVQGGHLSTWHNFLFHVIQDLQNEYPRKTERRQSKWQVKTNRISSTNQVYRWECDVGTVGTSETEGSPQQGGMGPG